MTADVALLDLHMRRRSLIGYAAGMVVYAFVIVVLYPAFENDTSLNEFTKDSSTIAALFGVTGSLTSPSGWLNANLYSNFVPLVVLLLTIGYGASCIAGQSEDGTLGLIATLPVSRRRIALAEVRGDEPASGDDRGRHRPLCRRGPGIRPRHRHRRSARRHRRRPAPRHRLRCARHARRSRNRQPRYRARRHLCDRGGVVPDQLARPGRAVAPPRTVRVVVLLRRWRRPTRCTASARRTRPCSSRRRSSCCSRCS